ncbi:hypothetical protein [Streptomyces sp. NPDC002547]
MWILLVATVPRRVSSPNSESMRPIPALTHFRLRARRTAAAVAIALLLVPSTLLALRIWTQSEGDSELARRQQHGITYAGALSGLLYTLASAESTAVRGGTFDAASVERALNAVEATGLAGSDLPSARNWTQLRANINKADDSPKSGDAAFAAWSKIGDQTVHLLNAVSEDSGLLLAGANDRYYLAEVITRRLPMLLVASARMDDLTFLAGQTPQSVEAKVRAGAAQAALAQIAAEVAALIHQALYLTQNETLGPSLISSMDQVAASVLTMTPIQDLAPGPGRMPNSESLSVSRKKGTSAAAAMTEAGLDRLLAMAQTDLDRANRDRWSAVGLSIGGPLAGLLLVSICRLLFVPRSNAEVLDVKGNPRAHGRSRQHPEAVDTDAADIWAKPDTPQESADVAP